MQRGKREGRGCGTSYNTNTSSIGYCGSLGVVKKERGGEEQREEERQRERGGHREREST